MAFFKHRVSPVGGGARLKIQKTLSDRLLNGLGNLTRSQQRYFLHVAFLLPTKGGGSDPVGRALKAGQKNTKSYAM